MKAWSLLAVALLVAACDSETASCNVQTNAGCAASLQCEEVAGKSETRCLPPVIVRGKVHDNGGQLVVEGGRVAAYSLEGAPISIAATTTAGGLYQLRVRAPRDGAGKPLSRRVRLRVDAAGYGPYPDGWRPWPEIDVAVAQRVETAGVGPQLVVDTADTDIGLIAFAGGPGIGTLCGTVPVVAGQPAPAVVAAFAPVLGKGAVTAFPDETGAFLLFGLPPGEVRARAFARGASVEETRLDLNTGENACRDLVRDAGALARVSGQVEITGGAGGTPTVALVVSSTYDAGTGRGVEPPGLRATAAADGSFAIDGVPAGNYVVVASSEPSADNDGLVPLAAPPHLDVQGTATVLPDKIRLVPALAVIGPGASAPEAVAAGPTLSWQDSALEESYHVTVLNYLGLEILARDERKHSGDAPMVVMDRPMVPGMLYRFSVQALDDRGRVLTRTEEGRGIFFPR